MSAHPLDDLRVHLAARHGFHGDPAAYPEDELREEHIDAHRSHAAAEVDHPPYKRHDDGED